MGTNYFTDEQLRLLEENPYVVKASKKKYNLFRGI